MSGADSGPVGNRSPGKAPPARVSSKFFVGIGAQKAGTSWLWTYLMSHPEVGFSPVKELHFFDSAHTAIHAGANRELPRIKTNLRRFLTYIPRHPLRGPMLLRHYLGTLRRPGSRKAEASYRAYLTAAAAGHAIAGEITPSYTMLGHSGVAAIERVLARPLYLLVLRNPADRFWSHVRYRARWQDDIAGTGDLTTLLAEDTYLLRSGYSRLWQVLAPVIAENRLHMLFYEHLFDPALNQPACDRLCDFLGVARHTADPDQRVNAGDVRPAEKFDRTAVIRALRDEYLFFAGIYGKALPPSWQQDLAAIQAGLTA